VLFARRDAEPPEPNSDTWRVGEESIDTRLEALSLPDSYRWFDPSPAGPVLTDDWNDIERRQRRSLASGLQQSVREP
jgi:hypothetical protein